MFVNDQIDRCAQWWRLQVARRCNLFGEALSAGLLIGALLFAYLVAGSDQVHEIFRVILEPAEPDWAAIAWPFLAAMLLSALLFFSYRWMVHDHEQDELTPRWARVVAVVAPYLVSLAPWSGGIFAILAMASDATAARETLGGLLSEVGPTGRGHVALTLLERLESHALAGVSVVGAGAVLTGLLLGLATRDRRSAPGLVEFLVFAAAGLVLLTQGALMAALDWQFIPFFKQIGPLATGLLTAISLFTFAMLISWIARSSGLPAYMGFVLLLLAYWGGATILEWASTQTTDGASHSVIESQPYDVRRAAQTWLGTSGGRSGARTPFLVGSAQGGGMYAATVSSLILSRVNEATNGEVDRKVFAISGVSGGSVGATLYHALALGGCDVADREDVLRSALLDAHLAPIIGNLPSDILRKFGFGGFEGNDRSDALSSSLAEECATLETAFTEHWDPGGAWSPALVLNTTWTATGHRVAFSPMSLREAGDGTLWSFEDLFAGDQTPRDASDFKPRMIDAAVASARFPGALPPLSLSVGGRWFNFGDGGYADASAVSTALSIYQHALGDPAFRRAIDPRLVMITFDYEPVRVDDPDCAAPGAAASAYCTGGTAFKDTWAPGSASLGVRQILSGQSITRARAALKDGEVAQISIDPASFGIALGWRLSQTSYETLSLLVGRPDWCTDAVRARLTAAGANPIMQNSCVAADLVDLVAGRPPS